MNAGAVLLKMALRTSTARTQRTVGCGASEEKVASTTEGETRSIEPAVVGTTETKHAPSPQDAGALAPKRQINSTASAD